MVLISQAAMYSMNVYKTGIKNMLKNKKKEKKMKKKIKEREKKKNRRKTRKPQQHQNSRFPILFARINRLEPVP